MKIHTPSDTLCITCALLPLLGNASYATVPSSEEQSCIYQKLCRYLESPCCLQPVDDRQFGVMFSGFSNMIHGFIHRQPRTQEDLCAMVRISHAFSVWAMYQLQGIKAA